MALVLCARTLSFEFLTDDYPFIQRAWSFTPWQLIPDPRSAFFRPIPRELYFAFIAALGNSPLLGHIVNALIVAATSLFVTLIGRRAAGNRAGITAGLFFASLGAMPILVGWVSGAQDLFALLFVTLAILAEVDGRRWIALMCIVAGLLSKETTLFFVPGIVMSRWMLGIDTKVSLRRITVFGGVLTAWAAIHPRVLGLLQHGMKGGAGGYVGVDNPYISRNLAREGLALLNVPVTGLSIPWPHELTITAIVGALLLVTVVALTDREPSVPAPSPKRTLLVCLMLGMVPAILTAAASKHWFPYYTYMPTLGTSLAFAFALERVPKFARVAFLMTFLLLGILSRNAELGARAMPTEKNFQVLSDLLKQTRRDLKQLHPTLEPGARLRMSVQAKHESALERQLVVVQAPRVWYSDSSIAATNVDDLRIRGGPEYLFWVTDSGHVYEIRLPSLRVRTAAGRPDYFAYQKAVRGYAYGLFTGGEAERAVETLLMMREADSLTWAFDRRVAATMMYGVGQQTVGDRLREGLPPLGREAALYSLAAILTPNTRGIDLDLAAFRACGVGPDDVEAYRFLMHYFSDKVLLRQAKRMADRILARFPDDDEAAAMIEAIKQVPDWEDVVVPIPNPGM